MAEQQIIKYAPQWNNMTVDNVMFQTNNVVGTGAKYQEDQTHSSRLRYQSLPGNKGEPSYEGEPDTQPMILSYSFPPQGDKPTSSTALHTEASDTDSSSDKILNIITEDQWEKHEEAVVYYVNVKVSINDYYNENIAHRDQIVNLMKACIATDDQAEDQRKLIKASSIVRPDPNEPIRVEFMINGKQSTSLNKKSKRTEIKRRKSRKLRKKPD
nr:hypothetical protein [Tanacetum cinerariifolium]